MHCHALINEIHRFSTYRFLPSSRLLHTFSDSFIQCCIVFRSSTVVLPVFRYDPTIEATHHKTIRFRKVHFATDIVDTAGMVRLSNHTPAFVIHSDNVGPSVSCSFLSFPSSHPPIHLSMYLSIGMCLPLLSDNHTNRMNTQGFQGMLRLVCTDMLSFFPSFRDNPLIVFQT